MLSRSISCLLSLLVMACVQSRLPRTQFYGEFKSEDSRVRLALDLTDKPLLYVISFRGYPLSITGFRTTGDSVTFRRTDANAFFSGVYHHPSQSIQGVWYENDTLRFDLTFEHARFDTIKGLNPRTTADYHYNQPPDQSDGIETGDISSVGLNGDGVKALVHGVMEGKFGYIHSLLVARSNRLVVEEYFLNISVRPILEFNQ